MEECKTENKTGYSRGFLDRTTVVEQAKRCLGEENCQACNLCLIFCPDMCIGRSPLNNKIEIDYSICRGCGICSFICPKGAIKMVLEAVKT